MNKTVKMYLAEKKLGDWRDDRPTGRFWDRDGREHYDNGRYAPVGHDSMWLDSRYGARNTTDVDHGSMRYPYTPFVPPVYRTDPRPMNKIGFAAHGEVSDIDELGRRYHQDAEYHPMIEMDRRQGSVSMMGRAWTQHPKLTKDIADTWTREMQNADGTKGAHWTMDQARQVMTQKGLNCDPLEFWVALNATYSDLCESAKKHNVNTVDYYVDTAIALWLKDKDAVEDKLAAYYEYVVRH